MIIVNKLKGKPYKTEEPCKALEAYTKCKYASSIESDGAIVRTRLMTGETSSRAHISYMGRC